MEPKSNQPSGFSLATLFVIVAFFAIIAAVVSPVATAIGRGDLDPLNVAGATLLSALYGCVIGAIVGLLHYRRLRGLGWGLLTGFATGACVGPIVVSPRYEITIVTTLGGSILLVTIGLLFNLSRSPRRVKSKS